MSALNAAIPTGTPIGEVEAKMRELGFQCDEPISTEHQQHLVLNKTESVQFGVAAVWRISVRYVDDRSTGSNIDLRFIGL